MNKINLNKNTKVESPECLGVYTLKTKAKTITQMVIWKIPHKTTEPHIELKIGRYGYSYSRFGDKVINQSENIKHKGELTLDKEELDNMLSILVKHKNLKINFKNTENREEENKIIIFLKENKDILKQIIEKNIIPEDLLIEKERKNKILAINKFERMLNEKIKEIEWQKWFKKNSWVFTGYILNNRKIDGDKIADILLEADDGFLDIIELKLPETNFWTKKDSNGNYNPSSELTKAITQTAMYVHKLENKGNDIDSLEKNDFIKTVKPKCTLIFGRSKNWDDEQKKTYRILNSNYHNLQILTYDHVLSRTKRILGDKNIN